MNQEEWLAERRRLGLPADPAKDFPPGYRADSSTASPAPTPTTRDHAASGSAPAPPGGRKHPLRGATLTLAIALVVLGGGRALLPALDGLFEAGGREASVTDTAAEPIGDDLAEEAASEATRLMTDFAHGDPGAVSALVESDPLTKTTLLTPATAKAAMGAEASFAVTKSTADGYAATVTGTLTTSTGKVPVSLALDYDGDAWVPRPFQLPTFAVNSDAKVGARANDAAMAIPTDPATRYATWPGSLTVTLPKDRFTTWKTTTLRHKNLEPLGSGASRPAFTLTATPMRTPEFTKQATAAAKANLKRCLASHELSPKNCPFGGSVPNAVTKVRHISFKQIVPIKSWKLQGPFGDETLWGLGGSVKITGQGYWEGSWGSLTGTLDVDSVGDVSVKNGKVVFSEH